MNAQVCRDGMARRPWNRHRGKRDAFASSSARAYIPGSRYPGPRAIHRLQGRHISFLCRHSSLSFVPTRDTSLRLSIEPRPPIAPKRRHICRALAGLACTSSRQIVCCPEEPRARTIIDRHRPGRRLQFAVHGVSQLPPTTREICQEDSQCLCVTLT